jgi:SAM-dependent methyltransferase
MDRSSRNRLTERLLPQFAGTTLFDAIARAVCRAGCLPRKELYEAWEVARRVRRRFRGGRIIDMACGHGLLAQILLLLDDTSPAAVAVDRRIPESAALLDACLTEAWPRLKGRVQFIEGDLEEVPVHQDDLIVSVHACGGLTDLVLDRALAVRARLAVLPCCHDLAGAGMAGLQGWLAGPLALDVVRATRVRSQGYQVYTQEIPGDITPKNRLLLAEPINLKSAVSHEERASHEGEVTE